MGWNGTSPFECPFEACPPVVTCDDVIHEWFRREFCKLPEPGAGPKKSSSSGMVGLSPSWGC